MGTLDSKAASNASERAREQQKQMEAAYRRLNDVAQRLTALSYPADVQGPAIKILADAIIDIQIVRDSLPGLAIGTTPA